MSSLLLLQSLFRLTEKHRVLFINLFRPGYWQGEDRSMEKIGDLPPNHYVASVIGRDFFDRWKGCGEGDRIRGRIGHILVAVRACN